MPVQLTAEFIKKAIRQQHPNYGKTVEIATKLRTHADGIVPEHLINIRRPSEPEHIKKYRAQIYVPITENPISKVINSLSKIRRSQDWVINHKSDIPSLISEEETLQNYCEHNFPGFTSITNWVFSDLLKEYLVDANSVVAIIPKSQPKSNTEYIKPVVEIFNSNQVIDFNEEEGYCVLKSADVNVYTTHNGQRVYQGDIYYIVTESEIVRYSQQNNKGDLKLDFNYTHNIGKLPAVKVGGVFYKRVNNSTIYKSRIWPMVSQLDEAAREYSDLQAEIVQHIHSEKYAYTNTECPICKGSGLIKDSNDPNKQIKCTNCNGIGSVQGISPYGVHIVNAAQVGEQSLPTPPIGYIQKSVDIAKLQDQRVDDHIFKALASLNMEFLAQSPLNQSGVAKEVDKDELNNFVNSIAEDIVRIMDSIYYFINEYRYSEIVPNQKDREAMLPKIAVPEKYDLLNSSYLMSEIKSAADSKVNQTVLKHLQIEYTRKKFNADPDKAKELECIFSLDPFYGYSNDEKMAMVAANGITMKDYVLSCNINQFVTRAIEEKGNSFFKMKYAEQVKLVGGYVDEIIMANDAITKLKKQINTPVNG